MRRKFLLVLVCCSLCSCTMVGRLRDVASELFGDEAIARVGDRKLLRSELDRYIPAGVSPEDSAALARQYIDRWAADLLCLEAAQARLSREEKDVTDELEAYRRTLLNYRYEQFYVNERLDTAITPAEVKAYYEAHPDKFILERPVGRVRTMLIPQDSPNLRKIKKLMSSDKVEEVIAADSLARSSALRYADRSEQWTDFQELAQTFGADVQTLVQSLHQSFIEIPDGSGNLSVAYVVEWVRAGRLAPLSFCSGRIRDLILSGRKRALLSGLERDLLEDARSHGRFVVYDNEK